MSVNIMLRQNDNIYTHIYIYIYNIYIYIYLKEKQLTYTIYDFLIQANSTNVSGALNKASVTKK